MPDRKKRARRRGPDRVPVSGWNPTGVTPAAGPHPAVPYESLLEADLHVRVAFDPTVRAYTAQPVQLDYPGRRGRTPYTPDLLVRLHPRRDGTPRPDRLVEVKFAQDLEEHAEALDPKFRAAEAYADANDLTFVVLDERFIHTPTLPTLTRLLRYTVKQVDERVARTLLRHLDARADDPTTAHDLALTLGEPGGDAYWHAVQTLWTLVAHRRVRMDLTARLTPHAPILPAPPHPEDDPDLRVFPEDA
ncbi:TnsA endonuclease N-terminal domain-containing protein [Deinococcus pimensis]|uniref:TnsA endonuclease N-terminal domain-containing protein n=1 Tax=Deinococcus pimensis TaxID=309888 RepID=UPI0004B85F2B|nr:TnsA endonuclease N-terminal domain-containing protein [Deinococcus pimensis]